MNAAFSDALQACLAASRLTSPARLAIAVSGGADSMALALLSKHYAHSHGIELVALTVDHRLRPESSEEAARVAEWMAQHGIAHHILPWQHNGTITGNLQEAARAARYQLLTDACQQYGCPVLLLGQHQDDQAETLLHHLVRGSGVDGLAAMACTRAERGIWLLRPLLSISKKQLVEFCGQQRQEFVHDPSNDNPRFSRVLLRQMLQHFAPQGLSAARLAETAEHMARAHDALNHYTAQAEQACLQHLPCGTSQLMLAHWKTLPEDIRLRLLRALLMAWNPTAAKPRFAALQHLQSRLLTEPSGRHTLGLLLWQWRADRLQCHLVHHHLPQAARVTDADLSPWQQLGWHISLPENANALTLAPLGEAGWEFLCAKDRPNTRIARRIAPPAAWQAMPVLWESAYGHLAKPATLPHIYPAGEPLPLVSPTTGACARFIAFWQPPSEIQDVG